MKKFFFSLAALFLLASGAWAQNCMAPATFDVVTNSLKLPCVAVAGPNCFSAELEYVPQPGKIYFALLSVNATDIPLEEVSPPDLIPAYDPDNKTLEIPAVIVGPNTYEAHFQLVPIEEGIAFELVNIFVVPMVGPVFCLPEINDDGPMPPQPEPEQVFSWQSYTRADNQPVLCYEYRGPREFIEVVSAVPPLIETGEIRVEGKHEPCPRDVPFTGCYRYDSDGNWYAQYKYDHPIADMIAPLFCPEENGYKPIIP